MTEADCAPFLLPGDDRGVLLVHGFGGSSWIWRFAAAKLAARGFTVSVVQLAGHDGTIAAFHASTWGDWVVSVETARAELARRCRVVGIAGLSLGGLLALHLARIPSAVAALATLGAPLWLPASLRLAIRAVGHLHLRTIPKGIPDVRDPAVRGQVPSPESFSIPALNSLLDFMAVVRAELPRITVPAFVAHGALDRTAPPACADEILHKLGSRYVRSLPLPRSGHLVTVDFEREAVAAALGSFFTEKLA